MDPIKNPFSPGAGSHIDSPADGSTLKMKRHQLAKSGQVSLDAQHAALHICRLALEYY